MLTRSLAMLRHLMDWRTPPEQSQAPERAARQPENRVPAPNATARPEDLVRSEHPEGGPFTARGHDQGDTRSARLSRLMVAYLGARAEELLELLLEGLSQGMAEDVARAMEATRDSLTAEMAGLRDSAAATQRECSRMGRELVRSGAALEGVQASLASLGAAMERLASTVQTEHEAAQASEEEIRQEAWSAVLGDVLATLDGLEAGLAEARALAQSLAEAGRRLNDPTLRRWWRAFSEASGAKRPLPEIPVSDVESWVRGLELTHRRLSDALQRQGITAIEATGKPFDPFRHEAVAVVACPPEQDGTVLREELRGYRSAERVLRLSQVIVGKAAPPAEKSRRPRRRAIEPAASESVGETMNESAEIVEEETVSDE